MEHLEFLSTERRVAQWPWFGATKMHGLIAAAPELLAALVAIRECTFVDPARPLSTPCKDCMDMVNAAIAKATGETHDLNRNTRRGRGANKTDGRAVTGL